jgi:Superinfection exclusion gene product 17
MATKFKPVSNKLRITHFPQVGTCKKSFVVQVDNEEQAHILMNVLSIQHIWLEKNKIIPDFSNAMFIEMYDEDSDGDGNPDWVDYWNEEEGMDWDELEKTYFSEEESNFSFNTLRKLNDLK